MHHYFILILLFVPCLLGIGCSHKVENLTVDKFTLRDYKIENKNAPMVRGDQQKRLYGAVSLKEHEARLGQYYEVRWNLRGKEHLTEHSTKGALLIFRYRQAATASKMKLITKRYPVGVNSGKIDFQIIGKDYKKQGRVLAWKAELVLNGRVIESKQSFLWKQ